MKSKKKFLLLGVGVMGALALGVGATSTFAWYSAAGATGRIDSNSKDSQSITAVDPGVSDVAVNLPVVVNVASVEATPAFVELSHYYVQDELKSTGSNHYQIRTGDTIAENTTGTAAGLWTAYHAGNADRTLIYSATPLGTSDHDNNVSTAKVANVFYRIYKVELTVGAGPFNVGGTTYTQSEAREKLANRTAKITFEAKATSTAVSYSRARYMPAALNNDPTPVPVATIQDGKYQGATDSATFTFAMTNINESSESYTATGYFAVYVEGVRDDEATNSDSGNVSAAFRLIVEDNAPNA